MAARVNMKLLVLLGLGLLSVTAVVGALVAMQIMRDAGRNAALGDKYLEQGDLSSAREHYGRALHKEPGNREYLEKYGEVLLMMDASTADRAREFYEQKLAVLRHATQHFPTNAQDHLALLEELHSAARLSSVSWNNRAPGFFKALEQASKNMLDNVSQNDPDRDMGRLYRAIARFNLRGDYSVDDLQETEEDLKIYLDTHPESDLGWGTLVISQWTSAVQLGFDNETRRAEERRADGDASHRRALELVPNGLEVAKATFTNLLYRVDILDEEVSREEAHEIVMHMIAQITPETPVWSVNEVMQLVARAPAVENREPVDEALSAYMQSRDRNPVLELHYAKLLYDWKRYDDAERVLNGLLEAEPLKVDFLAEFQFLSKAVGAALLNDIAYQRWADAPEGEEKVKYLAELKSTRDKVRELLSQNDTNPYVLNAEGKVAFAEGDYLTAVQKFEAILKDDTSPSTVEIYSFVVYCHQQLNNIGLALERVTQALVLRPDIAGFHIRKAELEMNLQRFDAAAKTARDALNIFPENEVLQRIQSVAAAGGNLSDIEGVDDVTKTMSDAQNAAREGDMEKARAILRAQLEKTPDDTKILFILGNVELQQGEREAARELNKRLLELEPENPNAILQQKKINNDDIIDQMQFAAETNFKGDEGRIAAAMVTGLSSLVRSETARIETLSPEEAATSRELLDRASSELQRQLAVADRLAPNDPAVVEYHFTDALLRKDWTKAEEVIDQAAKQNIDSVNGNMFRGRYQITRGEYADAVRTMRDVTAKLDFSGIAWRTLAYAYEQLGNFNDALRCYELAYRCDPTRMDTVRSYLRLLLQTGDTTRSLEVARDATRLAPGDTTIREAWLDLEAEVGNAAVALVERKETDERDPNNRVNAIRLAMLLGRLEPTRQLILDDAGKEIYSERTWNLLSLNDRTQQFQTTRAKWRAEADAIVKRLQDSGLNDLQFASLKAQLLRGRGDVAGGEQALRQFINATPEDQRTAQMYIALANYLTEAARNGEALVAYQQALPYQDDQTRPVDVALGDLYFRQGDRQSAIRHFERAIENEPNHTVQLRIVECMIELGQLGEAESRLNSAEQSGGVDFTTWMLRSAIAEQQGQDLLEQGNEVEANFRFDVFEDSLNQAQQLRPRDVLPKLRMAKRYFDSYRIVGNRTLLEEAKRVLAEADLIQANDTRVSLVRVDVLRELGDKAGAKAELQRLLERSPNENRARSLLVSFNIEDGNYDAAIDVVKAGIRNNETVAAWHLQLGDLQLNLKKDPTAALAAYRDALRIDPSPALVALVARVMLSKNDPPVSVLEFLNPQYQKYLESEPAVISVYARALCAAGQVDKATLLLKQIYARYDGLIDQGALDPTSIAMWFRIARDIIPSITPKDIENLLMELTANKPTAFELSSLSYLYRQSGLTDDASRARALELQNEAIKTIGTMPSSEQSPYYYDLGGMLIEAGRIDEAAAAFTKCIELNSDHALAYNNLAYLMSEQKNNPQKALEYANKAVAIQPDNPSILDTVGWIHFRLGNLDEAEEYLRKSVKFQESSPTLVHLAEVLAAKKEYDRARNALRRAEELLPGESMKAEINRVRELIRTKETQG